MPDFGVGCSWSSESPIPADAWKRAIYRRPPKDFHAQLLPPEKHGNSYSYGFRVARIKNDNASTMTQMTSSQGSVTSVDEYDVWRKWEDCLCFQDTLEVEYSRAAREKRNRLAAGKGVKKNGVYIHSDQAASWESLPFGPNPNDIARDIHEYIPKLTKKGTFFRASQETVDQRYEELQEMMLALLQDDLPMLIREIKATSTFSDFFGLWRRDVDLARKAAPPRNPTADRPRTSISSSILSTSPLSPSASTLPPSLHKGKAPEKAQVPSRPFTHSDSSSSEDSVGPARPSRLMDRKQETRSMRSRGSSSESRSSSSLPSTPVMMSRQLPSTSRQPIIASQETSVRFDHNPHVPGVDRCLSFLESLPEDCELPSSPKSDVDRIRLRKRSGSTSSNRNRTARIYVPSPPGSPQSSDPSSQSFSRYSRASLQSTHSLATLRATAYLDELDVDYCLPSPTPEPRCRPRASVSSMASIITNSSVDAVIPRSERLLRSAAQRAPSLAYESWSEDDSEDQGDILDDYFTDLIRPRAPTPDAFPETLIMDDTMYCFSEAQSSSTTTISSFSRFSDRRSSFTTISSGSTSSSGTTLFIKAMHEDNIVMLRLPRYIGFDDLRQKIYDKFMQIDNPTISESFAIALLEQAPAAEYTGYARPRAASLTSLGSAPAKGAVLYFISSQDEWDDVVATRGAKLLLRIIGSRA